MCRRVKTLFVGVVVVVDVKFYVEYYKLPKGGKPKTTTNIVILGFFFSLNTTLGGLEVFNLLFFILILFSS